MIEVKNLNFTYPGNAQKTIRGLDFKRRKRGNLRLPGALGGG